MASPYSASTDELFGRMAGVRSNLGQLFDAGRDVKLLLIVVDLQNPIFNAPAPPYVVTPANPSTPSPLEFVAMHKALGAEDYALIVVIPGTGKTTVIAAFIRELVRKGRTAVELVHAFCGRYHSDEARTRR